MIAALGFGWVVHDRLGWIAIPPNAPFVSNVIDPYYSSSAQAGAALLRRAHEELGLVGLSAAVSVDGKLVWTASVGWADIERGRPMTPETILRIGSTSKAVTATALARLVDAGIMKLDEPISTHLSELPNDAWRSLTPRHLASHTAGLPGYEENRDLWGLYQTIMLQRPFDDVRDTLDIFDDTDLLFEPGTAFHYSSFDVNLLGATLQAAAGKPFLALLDEQVFIPLGMRASGGEGRIKDASRIATFYETRTSRARPWRKVDLSQKWPSGGLLSTSADLTLLCGGWFDSGFLDPQTVQVFWEPQRLASGEVNGQNYAIGWRSDRDSEALGAEHRTDRVHHGGVSKGAMSWLVCYPQYKLGIALNINSKLEEFHWLADREPPITKAFVDALLNVGPATE